MPAQKRALDVAEDDPVQDNHRDHHEHPEVAEGTWFYLGLPKITSHGTRKISTTKESPVSRMFVRNFGLLVRLMLSFVFSESDRSPSSSNGDNKDEYVLSFCYSF